MRASDREEVLMIEPSQLMSQSLKHLVTRKDLEREL